jgi:hypothetical protein
MNNQQPRTYTRIAAAIIVAAIIVSATILATSSFSATVTRTSTQTTTELITPLVSSTNIATGTATNNTRVRVYGVTFQQVRDCGQFNIMPWAVTFNGLTEVEPSNQSIPLPTNSFSTIVPNQNLTRIAFSVPSGTYNYTVIGGAVGGGELYTGSGMTSGTIHVNGSDVLVSVGVWLSITCTSSGTAQT